MRKTATLAMLAVLLLACTFVWARGAKEPEPMEEPAEKPAAAAPASKYQEAPMLASMVSSGELPPVDQRLPENPVVVQPLEKVGKYGGTLRVISTSPMWDDVTHLRAEPILLLTPDAATRQPNVAEQVELSSDGKVLTVFLRKGIKWSDGEPFTADDIMFALKDVATNKDLVPGTWAHLRPGGVPVKPEKIDDYTVKLTFAVSYPLILDQITREGPGGQVPWMGGSFYLPKHYLEQFHGTYNPDADKLAKEADMESWKQHFQSKLNIFTDPELPCITAWKMISNTTAERVFERNPYYWKVDPEGKQLPYIDKLTVTVVQNLEVLNLKSVGGEVDFGAFYLDLENYTLYKENESDGGYEVVNFTYPLGSATMFEINQNFTEDPVIGDLLRDVKFRQALSLAIDRDEVNDVAFLGLGTPRQATVVPECSFYKEEWGEYYADYKPNDAKKLLDELGLKWDRNNEFRLRSDGETLTVIMEVPPQAAGVPSLISVCELVKEYWEEVGVKTIIKQEDRSLYNQRTGGAQHHIAVWTFDRATEFGVRINPGRFTGSLYAPLWSQWISTNGASGVEPPAQFKEHVAKVEAWGLTVPGTPEYVSQAHEIFDAFMEQIFVIGTVGMIPQPAIMKTNLRNAPEGLIWAADYDFNKIAQGETWFFE